MHVNQKFGKFLNFQFLVIYILVHGDGDHPFGKSEKSLEILRNKKKGDSQHNLYCSTELTIKKTMNDDVYTENEPLRWPHSKIHLVEMCYKKKKGDSQHNLYCST
jgi:hypothetical protein